MQPLSANLRGALLMTGAMTAFTINDTFLKLLGTHLPFFQIVFLRSIATSVFLFYLAQRSGALKVHLSRNDRKLIAIRTVAEAAAAWLFITALFNMPLANVSAILQALPLTVTLAAALFLGEPVGWKRFTAIGIGFVGVFLIVRPGTEGFTIYSLYALASVACVTVRDLSARRLSHDAPSLSVALATAVGVLIFSGIGAIFTDWQPMDLRDWLWLGAAVAAVVGGYLFSVMAMRVGEIGFVAPFRYTSLVVALVLGFAIFGEFPRAITLVGAAIVIGTGLFTLWRERALRRAIAAQQLVKGPGSSV